MQLHLSNIMFGIGELLCTDQNEKFSIELESNYKNKNIDITCAINDINAAIELKLYKKQSNRAKDIDMYDVLNDLHRLSHFPEFEIKRFFCLTNDPYYANGAHKGHASTVSIKNGSIYSKESIISPSW